MQPDQLDPVGSSASWWLTCFLLGVEEVSREARETARRVLDLREQHRAPITEHLGCSAANLRRVHEELFHRPIVAVGTVQEMTGVSFATANELVKRLVAIGVLREITGYSRNRRFQYDEYVRLFLVGAVPLTGREYQGRGSDRVERE